jgi:hypothetical protein
MTRIVRPGICRRERIDRVRHLVHDDFAQYVADVLTPSVPVQADVVRAFTVELRGKGPDAVERILDRKFRVFVGVNRMPFRINPGRKRISAMRLKTRDGQRRALPRFGDVVFDPAAGLEEGEAPLVIGVGRRPESAIGVILRLAQNLGAHNETEDAGGAEKKAAGRKAGAVAVTGDVRNNFVRHVVCLSWLGDKIRQRRVFRREKRAP